MAETTLEKGKLINIVMSLDDERLIKRLSERLGLNRSDTIRFALRRFEKLSVDEDLNNMARRGWNRFMSLFEAQYALGFLKKHFIDFLLNILTQKQKTKYSKEIDSFRKRITDSENDFIALNKATKEKQK